MYTLSLIIANVESIFLLTNNELLKCKLIMNDGIQPKIFTLPSFSGIYKKIYFVGIKPLLRKELIKIFYQ